MIDSKTVFTVSQFARHLNDSFRGQFQAVRLQGEIASFTRASSGHWYFALKDDTAQLKAVMFRQRNVLSGFTPQLGDKVEVLAQLAVYEQRGELQLIVDVLKKAGLGDLYERFLKLKAKLAAEGLFDVDLKQQLPPFVFNVGIVTSLQAAALADVRQALGRRCPHVQYTVYHTAVQGDAAADQIVSALHKADAAGHDVLILCRGGGSLEDLWSFNLEPVVKAVAATRTPIVVGVGHETDVTLAEFAADLRAATPTAAAELISRPTQEIQDRILGLYSSLRRSMAMRFQSLVQQVDRAELSLVTPNAHVNALASRIDLATSRLQPMMAAKINRLEAVLTSQANRFSSEAKTVLQSAQAQSDQASLRFGHLGKKRLEFAEGKLDRLQGILEAASPQRTLERGYAYLQSEDGQSVVSSVDQVKEGQQVSATLSDGHLKLAVIQKK